MKIALLTSEFLPFRGGVGSYARELAVAATAAGHTVVVLAPDYHEDCSETDTGLPFTVLRYPDGPASFRGLGKRIFATYRLLRAERFDVVHAIDWPFFIPVRLARRATRGARILLTVHGTEILYMREGKRKRLLDAIGFWRRGWASWIGNSRYTADLLLATFPEIAPEAVRAIPLGVSAGWVAGRVPRADARARYVVTDDSFVIISLGRVVPRKGHAVLAEALALLTPAEQQRLRWWIVGPLLDADHAATLKAAAAQLAMPVEFLGEQPDAEVRARLSAADLFSLPGYQDSDGRVEGFGLVFLEAAAYGVPSLASRSGGIVEAVDDGRSGLLVPERDPQALAVALRELIARPELRDALASGAEAKARAASWDVVMAATYRE